jgi:hypothetical protein
LRVGINVGDLDGLRVGISVGFKVGELEGCTMVKVGDGVGAKVGSDEGNITTYTQV